MHRVVQTLSLQAAIDRYLDREMQPAESEAFIAAIEKYPEHRAALDREIRFRNTLQTAERPPASTAFMTRLRKAINEA